MAIIRNTNAEARNPRQTGMTRTPNSKHYDLDDLEERTARFAKDVRGLIKRIKKTIGNVEDGKQVIRSSGSVGANYTRPVK
jgi:uncharacterized protein (DUF1810 family)